MKKNSLALTLTLVFSYIYSMMQTTFMMPILGNIAMAFPDAGIKIGYLMSIPPLIMIPAILLSGYLTKIVGKKTILVFASAVYLISGVFGGSINNIDYIVFMRAILGLATGLIFPLIPALIAQLYEGIKVPQMIGWGNAAGSIMSMVFATVTGYLAVADWHYVFYLYIIFAVLLIAQIMVLPNVAPENKDVVITKNTEKPKLNWIAWVYIIATFIYMVIAMVYIMKTSIFIMTEQIGNSAQSGMASSVVSGLAFVITLVFGQIFKTLKRYTPLVGFAGVGLCFFFLSIAHGFGMVVVASICMGVSLGTVLPYFMSMITKIVPKGAQTIAVTYVATAMYIGQFLAAYYITFLESLTNKSTRAAFSISAGTTVVIIIVGIIFIVATKKPFDKFINDNSALDGANGNNAFGAK